MIYREIFQDAEPARDYAIRVGNSSAPPYEFDLTQEELDELQAGQTLVLVVSHNPEDKTAIVLTRANE